MKIGARPTIETLVHELNYLGGQWIHDSYFWDRATKKVKKAEWQWICSSISELGYRIKRSCKVVDGVTKTVWEAVAPKVDGKGFKSHSEYFKFVNVRPNDGKPCHKGDCTTRCITYCLDGDYRKIEKKQHAIAKKLHRLFNADSIWDKILTDNGWVRVDLVKKTPRWKVADALRSIKCPIASESSGHVCAIHQGKVIDSWESQNGRVGYLTVPSAKVAEVKRLLKWI